LHERLPMADKIRLTLEVTTELNSALESLAETSGSTKSDVLRKAIALFEYASKNKAKGRELALIDKSEKVVGHVVGL
jgi:predicted transcriptional regulator